VTLHLAVLQHEAETGLGAFAAQLDAADVEYSLVRTTSGVLPDADRFDGAIALGGSLSVYDARLLETRRWIRNTVLRGMPFLGVCLGGQLLASALGAAITRESPEAGLHDVFLTEAAGRDPLFIGLPRRFEVFGWHEDSFDLAPGAVPLAGSMACTYQAVRFGAAAYGLQFHPEVRAADLARWRGVADYRTLGVDAGVDLDELASELRDATAWLDALAGHLLEHWLDLVETAAALASRRRAAA
jgi:GMP synthase-like glutamine amidotransferase